MAGANCTGISFATPCGTRLTCWQAKRIVGLAFHPSRTSWFRALFTVLVMVASRVLCPPERRLCNRGLRSIASALERGSDWFVLESLDFAEGPAGDRRRGRLRVQAARCVRRERQRSLRRDPAPALRPPRREPRAVGATANRFRSSVPPHQQGTAGDYGQSRSRAQCASRG